MGGFKVLTKREVIKNVAKRFSQQYENLLDRYPDRVHIIKALNKLDLEAATEKDVADIIGNDSWTEIKCELCRKDVDKAIHLTDTEYFIALCEECIDAMKTLLKESWVEVGSKVLFNGNEYEVVQIEGIYVNGRPRPDMVMIRDRSLFRRVENIKDLNEVI